MATQTNDGPSIWTDEELKRQIGQLFAVGFHGLTPSEDIKTLIAKHHIGAIILFQRNISSASQLLKLTRDLQQIAKDSGHTRPLLIAIDQENGLVTRIKPPIASQLPGSMAIAATGSLNVAMEIASATGEMLNYFGINMNYAPVADINSEPKNPVIGVRSFSDDPDTVSSFVSTTAEGLRSQGVIPCVKHFPGHGNTAVDSHYGLPVIGKTREELDSCELVPFKKAVRDGVEAVMTAHISLPALGGGYDEGNLPASLNRRVIGILRDEWGYDGVVISDCLEMDGVCAKYGTEESAVLALQAGTDSIMICHTFTSQANAITSVFEAVKYYNLLSYSNIATSYSRISRLKEKHLKWPEFSSEPDLATLEEMNNRHASLARQAYSRSATIIRSEPGLLPLTRFDSGEIVFMYPSDAPQISGAVQSGSVEGTRVPFLPYQTFQYSIKDLNLEEIWIPYYESGLEQEGFNDSNDLFYSSCRIVIILTRNAQLHSWQRLAAHRYQQMARMKNVEFVGVATCDPYDFLEDIGGDGGIANYVAVYEPTAEAFRAAIELLWSNGGEEGGVLPIGMGGK